MVKRTTQRKRSTKRRTARTKKAMTGGVVFNPFSSLRTREEDKTENKTLESAINNFCEGNGKIYNYIGGKNKNIDIYPIKRDRDGSGETTQFKNSLMNIFANIDISKVGVYIELPIKTQNNNKQAKIVPLSHFTGKNEFFPESNKITVTGATLSRNTLKNINGGRRSSDGGRKPFKYLYVIGKRELVTSQNQHHATQHNPYASMVFAPVHPSSRDPDGPAGLHAADPYAF